MVIDDTHQTRDIAEAEHALGRVYRTARFRSSAAPFLFRQQVQGDERATVGRFVVTAPTALAVDLEGLVGIGMCSGGNYRATTNGRPVDVARPFVLEPGLAQSTSDHHRLTIVNLDRAALARYAGDESGQEPRVGSSAPVMPESTRLWRLLVAHTVGVFSTPDLLASDLVRRAATDSLFAAAIAMFGIDFPGALADRSGSGALPSVVRRAMRYMDDNAHEAIGVQDVAEHARMSVRGLQSVFRRTAGMSPLEYLRQVRLSDAHRELLAADPRDTTVTEVALRWGFTNLTRFSALHRSVYRESPRETLRR